MAPREKAYAPLTQHDDFDTVVRDGTPSATTQKPWSRLWPLLAVSFLLSLALNAFALCRPASQHRSIGSNGAGLDWDLISKYNSKSPRASTDRAEQDEAWNQEHMLPWRLAVALDDSTAGDLGLLHSIRWPWDDDKGVYILQAGHQLHCLHGLRDLINNYQDGESAGSGSYNPTSYGHAMHCLDMLAQSIMCYADDSLLYVGYLNDNARAPKGDAVAGEGSPKTCRDWTKLRAWVDDHSACYDSRHNKANKSSVAEIERYKFCPDGSRPWEEL